MHPLAENPVTRLCALFLAGLSMGAGRSTAGIAVAAADHTLILAADGQLLATGLNSNGQLGVGDTFSRGLVHTLPGISGVTDVWSGRNASYLCKSDGSLWACGSGSFGLAGQGSSVNPVTTFRQVGTDTNWKQVSIGINHVLAVRNDGSLWSWGYGTYGELGQGSSSVKSTPTRIGSANDWAAVAAGNEHSLALKTTGTLWAWGRNESGRLGDGTTANRNLPVQIGTSTQWAAIAAGAAHNLALQSDGSMWAWGANSAGQLGDGTQTSRNTPTSISSGVSWKSISAGSYHSLALRMDDTLHAWGANSSGQLGLGDTTARSSPQPVAPGETWQLSDAGVSHSVAVRADGSVAWWGGNTYGQLGPAPATAGSPLAIDASTRPEISVSLHPYPSSDSNLTSNGAGTLSFNLTAEGAPQTQSVHIFNHGTEPLELSAFDNPPGFSTNMVPPVTLAPGAVLPLPVTIDTTVTGNLTGNLTITSNDADESGFIALLSGTVLSRGDDTDGDGLNDAAEWHWISLGFRWNNPQPDLVANLLANAPRAGLFTNAQLAAARPGSVVVESETSTGQAGVRLQLDSSANLESFTPAGMNRAAISSDGRLLVPVDDTAPKGFFRFSVTPLPSATP
jgi:alpha-tubulin suppressor-like RCC1 family protein